MKIFFFIISVFSLVHLNLTGQIQIEAAGGFLDDYIFDVGVKSSQHSTGFHSASNVTGMSIVQSESTGLFLRLGQIGIVAKNFEQAMNIHNNVYGIHSYDNDENGIKCYGNGLRAGWFIGDSMSTVPAVEIEHENDLLTDLKFGGIARITSTSDKGISLIDSDMPLITRGWAPFTGGKYEGVGRWGLFMESAALTLGIPNVAGRKIIFAKYDENSTFDTLVTIDQGGVICAAGYTLCSDIRYKQSVHTLENSLEKLAALRGVSYFWNQEQYSRFSDEKQIGFIAQEVESIFPELVRTDESGYKSVAYDQVTPILVEAIKEQQKQIEDLKGLVNDLIKQMDKNK